MQSATTDATDRANSFSRSDAKERAYEWAATLKNHRLQDYAYSLLGWFYYRALDPDYAPACGWLDRDQAAAIRMEVEWRLPLVAMGMIVDVDLDEEANRGANVSTAVVRGLQ